MPAAQTEQRYTWLYLLIGLSLAFNMLGLFGIGLLPDEAYYWVWSQRLEAGYFDHPSLVAWLIRPFTELFGNDVWAVRLPGVLTWAVGTWLACDLGTRLYNRRSAGLLAGLIWASLPIIQIGFHIITPDTPMLLFGWLSYYFACRAVMEERPSLWLLTGLCIGLAVAGKYPGALIAIGLLLSLLLLREGRRYLLTPWPWLATATALLVFAPVLWWNMERDWLSFAFQLGHGIETQSGAQESSLTLLLLFIAGQFGVAMPWTLLAMLYAALFGARRLLQAHPLHYPILLLGFLLPLLVFGGAALTTEGHPNWPVSAYIGGTLLLAGVADRWLNPESGGQRAARRRLLITAFVIPLLLVNLLRFPHWLAYAGLQLPPQRTQLSQSYGWDKVASVLATLLPQAEADNPYGERCIVIGNKLQTASMLGFLLQDAGRVTASVNTRYNQFHLWQEEHPIAAGAYCLYFEQFEADEWIPEKRNLKEQGVWHLVQSMVVEAPDLSRRQFAFYLRRTPLSVPGASSRTTPDRPSPSASPH